MAIQHWEPIREMVSLRDAMNSLLQESFVRPTGMPTDGNTVFLPLDIAENENEFIVKAPLPGVPPENVQITAHGDTLIIRGEVKDEQEKKDTHFHLRERRFGRFERMVSLATPINAEKARADFENGVLTLILPKAEEAKPKQIKIGGTGQGKAQVGQGTNPAQGGQAASPSAQAAKTN